MWSRHFSGKGALLCKVKAVQMTMRLYVVITIRSGLRHRDADDIALGCPFIRTGWPTRL
jgi:hypothetical protein